LKPVLLASGFTVLERLADFLNNGAKKLVLYMIDMKRNKFDILLTRIGCGLTRLREGKGYDTIKQFAADHQLPFIQYWRIEKGKANITLKTLLVLLTIHGISLDDFFEMVRLNC
jgi:hypothetical protein